MTSQYTKSPMSCQSDALFLVNSVHNGGFNSYLLKSFTRKVLSKGMFHCQDCS